MQDGSKIFYCTGARSDYGLMRGLLFALNDSKEFELHLVATGMHVMSKYGGTITEVENEFNSLQPIFEYPRSDTLESGAEYIGNLCTKLSKYVAYVKPDLALVLGDRNDQLATTIACAYQNIPIVHLRGGEETGTIDDVTRQAISKYSHLHLVATDKCKTNLLRIGEDEARIKVVGELGLDELRNRKYETRQSVAQKYKFDEMEPILLFIYHPVQYELDELQRHITNINIAIDNRQVVWIYPNSDTGSQIIIDEMQKYVDSRNYRIFENLPRGEYLDLLNACDCMLGNSSSGIVEAASLNVPVIDIGTRQRNRERSKNVFTIQNNYTHLESLIEYMIKTKSSLDVENVYGDGQTVPRIMRILETLDIDNNLLYKRGVI